MKIPFFSLTFRFIYSFYFLPFPDKPEFYATYKLLNVKNHHIYSDNLILSVIDLTQINLATKENKVWQTDYWASLFKAATWEEIKMLAQKNNYLTEASNTIFHLNADEQIQKRCRDREDYYQDIRTYERDIKQLQAAVAEKDAVIAELEAKLAKYEKK